MTHEEIYKTGGDKYDLLVSREDYKKNLFPALSGIVSFTGASVVESGAGTGRLTSLLIPFAKHIFAFDNSLHMLEIANKKPAISGFNNWSTGVADHRKIPLKDSVADIFISGWSISYLLEKHPHNWKEEFKKVFFEIKRLLRPGGTVIIIESLGTGREEPEPPTESLRDYYNYLEKKFLFSSIWLRTDYKFETLEEADNLVRNFFGQDLADHVKKNEILYLPECTGIWRLKL